MPAAAFPVGLATLGSIPATSSATSPGISASPATSNFLADRLDATFVAQIYSRLVIDCNRDHRLELDPRDQRTDHRPRQPGRQTRTDGRARTEIFWPYHDRITALLDHQDTEGHADGARLDAQLHAGLQGCSPGRGTSASSITATRASPSIILRPPRAEGDLVVGDNEPYRGQRPHRLHDPRPWRAARPAPCRARDPRRT